METGFNCPPKGCAKRSKAYLTTSWDDGHPLDLRLAELLQKYGIPATFYVPRRNVLPVMDAGAVRQLAAVFEIGGHTLNHVDLLVVEDDRARSEITGCRIAVEEITGMPCRSFCFPKGHYRRAHVAYVREAGFTVARTVELMSIAPPRERDGIALMATTVQARSAPVSTVFKNLVKRGAFVNALNYMRYRGCEWAKTAEGLLEHAAQQKGVFHLWGHSWEIDECNEWKRLEEVFSVISERKEDFHCFRNGEWPSILLGSRGAVAPS